MIELRKNGVDISPKIVDDLRSAKLMIKISESSKGKGEATQKLEECLGIVESSLIGEAEKVLKPEIIDEWLRRLDESMLQTCEIRPPKENKFVTGVPKDQKWVRIEPLPNVSATRLIQIAKETKLAARQQTDGRLVVYGQQESIQVFLKRIADEAAKK